MNGPFTDAAAGSGRMSRVGQLFPTQNHDGQEEDPMRHRIHSLLRAGTAGAFALGLVLAAPAAFAADDRVTDEQFDKIKAALEAKGYKDIRDAEIDDGRFEVDAIHPDLYAVDLELDMTTLEILHEKRD